MAVATVATGVMVLSSTAVANAHGSQGGNRIPVIHLDVSTAGGFSLPSTVRAGLVTFEITATDTDTHAIQGFRVNPHSTLEQVMDDVDVALLSEEFADRAPGVRALTRDATLVGGVVTAPSRTMSVTMPLEPGTYHFFDLGDLGNIEPRIHTIRATGSFRPALPPRIDAVVATRMHGTSMPMFITPRSFGAKSNFLFVNNSAEIHEVVFRGTRPGITDQYVTDFYNAILAGGPVPQSPWTDVQHGLQSISPGRWAIMHLDLPPGEYSEICYVPDWNIGIPHGWEGMHQQVTLR